MDNPAKTVIGSSLGAIIKDVANEKSNLAQIFQKVAAHPIKMVAAFFTAPFLIIRVAFKVKNPIRRVIAVTGLALSIFLAYGAGTYLGKTAGAFFIMFNVGFLTGLGFLFGSILSVFLSVSFSIFVLNSVSLLFLKMSTQEVVDYLNKISTDSE